MDNTRLIIGHRVKACHPRQNYRHHTVSHTGSVILSLPHRPARQSRQISEQPTQSPISHSWSVILVTKKVEHTYLTTSPKQSILISDITIITVKTKMKHSILDIRKTILNSQIYVFSSRDLSSLLELSPRLTLYYLQKGIKDHLFLRLKNGLYTLATDPARIEEIANRLYAPSYLSFEFALSHYNLIPETIYSVTSATTKATREYEVNGTAYTYTTIPPVAYTGYIPLTQDYRSYLIADPEKAVVDYLYLLALGRRGHYERLDVSKLDHTKITQYLSLFKRPSLYKLFQEFKESNVNSIIY